jgi:hypothetical protein
LRSIRKPPPPLRGQNQLQSTPDALAEQPHPVLLLFIVATYSLGAGLQIVRPANPRGWPQITSNWRERATPKRACGCAPTYVMLTTPSPNSQSNCNTMSLCAPIRAGDDEAQRYADRTHETHVRAHRTQSSSMALCQRLIVIMTRLRRLIQIARNPYRPELYYMRGPGPKWYAKHQNAPL